MATAPVEAPKNKQVAFRLPINAPQCLSRMERAEKEREFINKQLTTYATKLQEKELELVALQQKFETFGNDGADAATAAIAALEAQLAAAKARFGQ